MSKNKAKDAYRLLEAAKSMAISLRLTLSKLEEIEVCDSFDSDDFDGEVIVIGDWNDPQLQDNEGRYTDRKESLILSRLKDALENNNIECPWDDTVIRCNECNLVINNEPTHMFWIPNFVEFKTRKILCLTCVHNNPEQYLSSLEDDNEALYGASRIDFEEHGYARIEIEINDGPTGLNPATNAIAFLRELGLKNFFIQVIPNSEDILWLKGTIVQWDDFKRRYNEGRQFFSKIFKESVTLEEQSIIDAKHRLLVGIDECEEKEFHYWANQCRMATEFAPMKMELFDSPIEELK